MLIANEIFFVNEIRGIPNSIANKTIDSSNVYPTQNRKNDD